VTQSVNANIDPMQSGGDNGDSRSGNHGLMVREYEMNGLSPYMAPGVPGPYVDAAPVGMNFSQLAHAFRRRWLLALIAGLAVGVPVAALVWLVTPENYEVTAWLRVGDPPGTIIRNPSEYDQYRKTQAARIKSPLVLQAALRVPGISELPMIRSEREPIQFLQDELAVVSPLESEVLLIKMRGKDKTQLVKVVNAVHDAYLEKVNEGERGTLLSRQGLLDRALKDKDQEIDTNRKTLAGIKRTYQSADREDVKFKLQQLSSRSNFLQSTLQNSNKELLEVKSKLQGIQQRKEGDDQPEYQIEAILGRDPQIIKDSEKISELQQAVDYQAGVSKLGMKDPQVIRLSGSINKIMERVAKRRDELRPQIIEHLQNQPDTLGGLPSDPRQLEIRRERLEESIASTEAEYADITKQVAEMAKDSAEIETYENKIKVAEERRGVISKELDEVVLNLEQQTRVTSLERGSEPEGTNPMFRYVLTVFAGLAGLIIGTGAVVGMEYQARRLSTTGEISTSAGLRVLGTVPNLDALSHAKGPNGAAALQGILAESVDSIRTVLLQQSRENAPRVIMVTSAGDREGKTTVASHLAASLARSGHRTLLVDGDLRSPTAHAMFGAALDPGLCEMLRGELDLESAIQPTQVDGLMLVSAGQCDYHSIASLSKSALKAIFDKAREQFEFIVIDAAPVLNYADTLLMGAHIDAAVLSVRRDISQLGKVQEARERMESVGIRILGAVINGISETTRRPAFALPSAES
jgi:polysaccharide biosynthesis transport protein